jgi:selenocysteine-specific elongation factor
MNDTRTFFTIGMAGHIDHGKTTLTKALTGVDTDRLKEEKERQISIELGYAPFPLGEYQTSIIDVPGHEKFIRQMIAGVAGIDLVILVVAADEGVMPQTKEHLEILGFLGIRHGVIALTKSDKVDAEMLELVEMDVREHIDGTIFADAPMFPVDSISGKGLPELKDALIQLMKTLPVRDVKGTFRLPIDQVFTVQGQGTVVRGTIYEGVVRTGDLLTVLPQNTSVRARQLQVHHEEKPKAEAGQRVAINISGLSKDDLHRGDVLVASQAAAPTQTIDVALHTVLAMDSPVKQRTAVKFHSATAEVMGKIVFFDRNELTSSTTEVLCQIRLDEPVVLRRGDRFVLRRPSPVKTIGGGYVVDPWGTKHRFGEKTMQELQRKKAGTPEERILDTLSDQSILSLSELSQQASLDLQTVEEIAANLVKKKLVLEIEMGVYTSTTVYDATIGFLKDQLTRYHEINPMRVGMPKAELLQAVHLKQNLPKKLQEWVLDEEVGAGRLRKEKQYIALADFEQQFPQQWKQRILQALEQLKQEGLAVKPWEDYLTAVKIPDKLHVEIKHYIVGSHQAYALDDKYLIHGEVFDGLLNKLQADADRNGFTVVEAKTILDASRKNVVLFLELLDQLQITRRAEDKRVWA